MTRPAIHGHLRQISAGERFEVFRAERAEDQRRVVLKMVRAGRREPRNEELLRHEWNVIRGLDLAGVARPLDLEEGNEGPVLVLEDAGAQNLCELLDGRPLETSRFLELAIPMAETIAEVHRRGVIHRDVCPTNFVLGERLTLVDFETATTTPAFTQAPGLPGELEGTLAYIAPEQTGRTNRRVDRRADLYALGATFYEMLTGAPPFSSRDPLELLHAHVARRPHTPAIVNGTVPTVLSNIVIKLLSKMPEWRYQSADALKADLEEARRRWRSTGEIQDFDLGLHDVPYGLLVGGNLYGRERAQDELDRTIERVSTGRAEVVLVAGPAGIGKSALVRQVRDLAGARCRWLEGKGDLLQGNVPYAPMLEAFRGSIRDVLRQPADRVAMLGERLREAVSPNGRVLTETIPELEEIIGEQPPVADVGPVEAQHRFQHVFVALVRALIEDAVPLVLFLDDLQWADPASLTLLAAIATDPDVRGLLIVGAYRTEEIGADHPLWRAAARVRASETPIATLELGALERSGVVALLCEALHVEPQQAGPLAEAIEKKTAGNPFFVRQFLGYLYQAGLLVYDPLTGRWAWETGRIEGAEVTENVVDLLSRTITMLSAREQDVLETAACVGNEFGLGLLAGVRGETLDEVARALWAPVQEGLIAPATAGPRFPWAGGMPLELGGAIAPAYRFVHDRVQEASYQLLGGAAQKDLHLKIGRWLLANVPEAGFDDAICSIVDHLDRAMDRLAQDERSRLAHLNRRAGRIARTSTAYGAALRYFSAGLELLSPEPWSTDSHDLWFGLVRDAAECAASCGDHLQCERLVEDGLWRTEVPLEKAELCHVLAQSHALRGAHEEAIRRGREGLRSLGVDLPEHDASGAAAAAERDHTRRTLSGRSDRELLEMGPMRDGEERERLKLLVSLAASSWFTAPELFKSVCVRAVDLTARRGVAQDSPFAFAAFGIALAMDGEYEEAHRFGRLAVALAERASNAAQECRALMALGGHVSPWRAPLRDSVPLLRRAHARGIESGELEYAAYAVANLVFVLWCHGATLETVLTETDAALAFYRRIGHAGGVAYVAPFTQAARSLKGLTRERARFDDVGFDEARFLREAAENGLGQAVYHLLRLQTAYLLDEPALALEHARKGERWLPHLRTIFLQVDHFFYVALALSSLCDRVPATETDALRSELRAHHRRLELWAVQSPASVGHKLDVISAEIARLEKRRDVVELYERAIAGAAREGWVHDEALAHERCARFLEACGDHEAAEVHFRAAAEGYAAWGASAKVALLARESPAASDVARSPSVSSGGGRALRTLDLRILLEASETLSSELVLDRLLRKLMQICVEAASAERSALVLEENGLLVRAVATAENGVVVQRTPLAESSDVPASVVEHVLRTGAVVLSKDAVRDARFASDPYVARIGVRSVMAVPLRKHDRTVGILYFENDLVTDAFTPERVEVFRLLSAQMAIALENSLLFAERERAERALRLLADASAALSESLDHDQVLATIGALAVPALAEWCIIDVLDGRDLRPGGSRHAQPSKQALVEELRRVAPPAADSPQPQAQALRSRKPLLVPDVTDDFLRAGARDEKHLRLLQALDPRSLIVVPLVARGRAIGVLTLVRGEADRRYGEAELSLADGFARRAALAMDNARLHRELQEAVRVRNERDRYLRMIFRQVPGTIWATDRSLRYTHLAGNLQNAPDLDATELLGSTVYDFVGTRDPSEPGIARHLAALAGEPQSFQYQYRERWYEASIEPLRDQERGIVGCVGAAFDVTERRANAERLARSEARLAEAQRVAHIGSFEWDVARNVVAWSDELQRIYGLEPGQFDGKFEAFLERVHPDDLEDTKSVVFDAYRNVKPFVYDHRVVRADGSVRMLHTRGDVVADERGRPAKLVGSCWDVTELKESIRNLEHAVSRWEATLDATAEGILVVDLEGNVSAVNHRFMSLWRVPAAFAPHRRHLQLLAPVMDQLEDPDAFLGRIREIYDHPEQESFDVVRFKDGRMFERHSIPQRIGEEVVGRVWSLRDVTERERLFRRALFLADATRLLASLDVEAALDSVAHMAVPFLGDGCAIDLLGDGGPRRLLAVSRDPTQPINPELHRSVVGGHPTIYALGVRSYMAVPLLVKGALVGAMTFVAAATRRYTPDDLQLAEELGRRAALSVANARLYHGAQEALRARDEFLSIAAHEIRGPITSIHMAVQGLQGGKIPKPAMPKVLEIIEREDRRLARFVDELLDLGRIRGGRLHITYEQVDLSDVVREATARLGAELAGSGSSLSVSTEGRLVGEWDRFRLEQVVTNLISNAIKFGLGKPISISVSAHHGTVALVVKDQGIGIAPDMLERIFLPFERAVAVRHYGGLGLGLYIARTIVEDLGGKISVESSQKAGSTFTVELPQARSR
jgi:PAS domain S-box-containing protein